jgi:23S rRNA (guanosine2251-2'-O)-methyltransferase
MAVIITGKNTVSEAIKAGRKVHELYIQSGTNKDVVFLAEKLNIKVIELDKNKLNNILPSKNQGIGAKVADYTYVTLEEVLNKDKPNKVFLMLDGLEDPHNLGAILRSVDAFSVDAVIVPKNRSVKLNATVAKVSTGAIEHVDVVEVTNLNQTIKKLKSNDFWIVGTDADTDQTIKNIAVDTNLCVVIGSEGKGMSRMVKENCDYTVKIPMSGHVNSLNASVSAAIVIYEIFSRKG